MPLDDAARARNLDTVKARVELDTGDDMAKVTQIIADLGDPTPRDAICIEAGYLLGAANHRAIIIGAAETLRSALAVHRHGDIGCLHCVSKDVIGSFDDILLRAQAIRALSVKVREE